MWQSSTTPWNMNGSPPLTVNQNGAVPSDRSTFSHSSRVSSFSRFIQMLQVRQRELQRGDGDRVMFSGNIRGQPKLRYSLNRGIRASTPSIDFMGITCLHCSLQERSFD